jgi:hypothetical protein
VELFTNAYGLFIHTVSIPASYAKLDIGGDKNGLPPEPITPEKFILTAKIAKLVVVPVAEVLLILILIIGLDVLLGLIFNAI